jgi:hypothetical protein
MIALVDLPPRPPPTVDTPTPVDNLTPSMSQFPIGESDTNRRSRAFRGLNRTRCPSPDKNPGLRSPECRSQPKNAAIVDPFRPVTTAAVTLRVICDRLCCIGDRQPMLGPRVLHYHP